MTEHDALDRRLSAWMREAASEPQPAGRFDQAITASTRRRPLPRWRANIGLDWVGTSPHRPAVLAWPLRRAWPAVILVLALLVVAVILGALAAGARLTVPPVWHLGGLAYAADGDIYVAKADGSSPVRIADGDATGPGPEYSFPRWSPDGRYLLFEANGSAIVVTDAAGHRLGSFVGRDPMWAPDSSRIASVSIDSADPLPASYPLELHAVDGRLLQTVTIPDFPAGFGELAWSPDAKAIVALPWLVPLDGSLPRPFTTEVAAPGSDAAFSPDGSEVAIVATHGLYIVASDGTGSRLLAPLPPPRESDGYASPVWSPDGQRIAVWKRGVGDRSGAGLEVIDVVTADARTIEPVTHPGPGIPRWSPDGSRLLALVPGPGVFPSLASVAADGSGSEAILVDALGLAAPPSGDWQWIRTSTPASTPAATVAGPSPTPAWEAPSSLTSSPTAPQRSGQVPEVQAGQLAPGTYDILGLDDQGFNVRFTVPGGWMWTGRSITRSGTGPTDAAEVFFYGGPLDAYADPCHWAGASRPLPSDGGSPVPVDTAAAAFIDALARQPSGDPPKLLDRPANTLLTANRWPGTSVELTVPGAIDLTRCDRGEFRRWGPEAKARPGAAPGQHDLVWAIGIDGASVEASPSPPGGLVIDAATFPDTPPSVQSEVDAILRSIEAGHWG